MEAGGDGELHQPSPCPTWGGGGVLSLKKGTDCRPTIEELLLSRVISFSYGGVVKVFNAKIVDQIPIMCL